MFSATYSHSLLQANGQNTSLGKFSFKTSNFNIGDCCAGLSGVTYTFHILLVEKSKLQIFFFFTLDFKKVNFRTINLGVFVWQF